MPDLQDDDFQPIRALNDVLFCERRCALHRTEQLWVENASTVEGTHAHRKVHADPGGEETDGTVRVARRVWLRSNRLRLVGIADLVEFRPKSFPGTQSPG